MLKLRRADPADATAIGVLQVTSWRETYRGILPDRMLAGLSPDKSTTMWGQILGDPEAQGCIAILVAERDGRMIGFGACGQQRDPVLTGQGYSCEIGAIYILRAHQDRGAGRSIMVALSQALTDAGHIAASLWVLRENLSARGFYERLGGAIIRERTEMQADVTLVEVAYGWPDISAMIA